MSDFSNHTTKQGVWGSLRNDTYSRYALNSCFIFVHLDNNRMVTQFEADIIQAVNDDVVAGVAVIAVDKSGMNAL